MIAINKEEQHKFEEIVNSSLDKAEKLVKELNVSFDEHIKVNASVQRTNIPGYKFLGENEYKSDFFLAFMLDMRDSTKHLIQAISNTKASQMKRVFYEVSALLPVMASIVENTDGAVTEYLGDGFLALFQFPFHDEEKRAAVCKMAMNVARKCLVVLKQIVNPILNKRYNLPNLEIGIGMAISEAIITHFGIRPNTQVKVIGRCIYDVSKLSKEHNRIVLQEHLNKIYPSSKTGILKFTPKIFDSGKLNGYILEE